MFVTVTTFMPQANQVRTLTTGTSDTPRLNRKLVACELPADSLSATASGGCFNNYISLVVPSSWAAD